MTEIADAADRRAVMARDFAQLTPRERDRTFVIDTTRDGRGLLTQATTCCRTESGLIAALTLTLPVHITKVVATPMSVAMLSAAELTEGLEPCRMIQIV